MLFGSKFSLYLKKEHNIIIDNNPNIT